MRIWGVFLFFTIPRDKTKSKICRKTCLLRDNGCEDWVILQKIQNMSINTYYTILGITECATFEEIQKLMKG